MSLRRTQITMAPEEISTYIRPQSRLILTSNGPNGYPHPMPMKFIVDDEDRVLITTFNKSQKVLNFARDPRAALLIESGARYSDMKSKLVYAKAEIIEDLDIIRDIMVLLARKRIGQGDQDADAISLEAQTSASKRVVMRFAPDRILSWDHSKLGRFDREEATPRVPDRGEMLGRDILRRHKTT